MLITRVFARKYKSFLCNNVRNMSSDSYVWIDLEMTGLDPSKDTIMEVACIITTPLLEPKQKGINLTIHQSDEVLKSMNSWCIEHHGKTGLTEACRNSTLSLEEADTQVSDYIKQHTNPKGVNYLAGNSVYVDKMFLSKYMPSVNSLIHYRLLDVSSIKILCSHWYPEQFPQLCNKRLTHRALDDILDTIEELKNYRSGIFK